LASLELTIPNLALPAIARDLAPSSTQSLWIVDIYGFLLAGSLVTMGTLGDRIGRRRLLMIGSAVFGVGSVVAAYSVSAEMLIVTRALLGIAGATLMPASLSLVAAIFADSRQRTTAIGIVVASVAGGTAAGPLVGGWLLQHFWWGTVFLIAVPVTLVFLALAAVLLPESRNSHAGRLDILSAALSVVAILATVFGLKSLAEQGSGTLALSSIVVGVVVAAVFLYRQRKLGDPLVDLKLFRSRSFTVSMSTLLLGIFVLFGTNFYLAQYLQLVFGLPPLYAGLWTAPAAAGVIVGSTLAPIVARRVRPGAVIGVGLLVSAAGFGVLTQVGGLATLVVGSVIVSLGLGPMLTLSTDLVVGSAPVQRAGEASALSEMSAELGGALGIAILGSIGVAFYRNQVAEALPLVAAICAVVLIGTATLSLTLLRR
jgi:DHA2 family multidrug resistance protein-like MFS transporter